MKEQILKGFREIAEKYGYPPEVVYFDEGKLILPPALRDKIQAVIQLMEGRKRT